MKSPKYLEHKERSNRDREDALKQEHGRMKAKCHHLRADCRQAVRYTNAIAIGKLDAMHLPWRRARNVNLLKAGELDRTLDALTREHGFGTLRSGTDGALEAPYFVSNG